MTHEFSVEIHEYIKIKIAEAQKGKKQADASRDAESGRFYEGQLHELMNLREYLTAKVDLKTQKYY